MSPTLNLAFDSATLHALRAAVQAHACQAGMPEDRAVDVVLAVHELAANAVRHGAGAGRLRIWSLAGELCCEVEDAGTQASEGQAGADPWPYKDGHGLWVVQQVTDQMEVVSGPAGTRATVTFKLHPGDIRA